MYIYNNTSTPSFCYIKCGNLSGTSYYMVLLRENNKVGQGVFKLISYGQTVPGYNNTK